MAQKDVEIRIKAKDDASKGVKKISEALKVISTDASAAAEAAKKGGGAFGALAADLNKLKTQSSKLQAFGVITSELDKASASLERAQRSAKDAEATFGRLASQQASNAVSLSRMRGTIAAEEAAQKASKESLREKNKEVTRSNQLVREAEAALARYNKQLSAKKVGGRNTDVFTGPATDQTTTKSGLEADARIAKKLQEDAIANAKRYRDEVTRSTEAIRALRPQVSAADKAQKQLDVSTERAAISLRSQRENLSGTSAEFNKIRGTADGAKVALGGVAASQDSVANASDRMVAKIAAAQTQLAALRSAKTASVVKQDVDDPESRERVVRATFEANKAYRVAQEEVRILAAEMKAAKAPTEELGNAFGRAQAKVKLAAAAYREQQAALRGTTTAAQSSFSTWSRAVDGKSDSGAATNMRIADSARTATNAQNQLAPALQRTTAASRSAAAAGNQFSGALLGINRDTRKSLGLLQRLRGEVLAITASYLGFHAAIRQIGGALNAFRDLEAAQSRLGAVFNQDTARVAQEVSWLRGEADRLGISFSVLSGQYTKFAVAAKQANFSSENTRKMFLSVAEAGRVNKLSMDQLNGTFMAIEQIISKGKFTSEEVRRQLGDRLPGAFNILSAAMGKTTMELDKMMSSGELLSTESNLLKFTNEMSRQFGPQLSASLETLTTDMGRFENDVFKSQLALADGFIPALREALQAFNEFANSERGHAVFVQMGQAIGRLGQLLLELPKYFTLISTAIQGIIALKIAGWVINLVASLRTARAGFMSLEKQMAFIGPQMERMTISQRILGQGFATMVGAVDRYRTSLVIASGAAGVMTARNRALYLGLGALRGVMILTANVGRTMWAAIGGLPGLIVTGIVVAVSKWFTSVDAASSALSEHTRQVNAVKEAYEVAGGDVDLMVEKIKGLNQVLAEATLVRLTSEFEKASKELVKSFRKVRNEANNITYSGPGMVAIDRSRKGDEYDTQIVYLGELLTLFESGEMLIEDFVDALDDLNKSSKNDEIKKLAQDISYAASNAEDGGAALTELGRAIQVAREVVGLFTGDVKKLSDHIDDASNSTGSNAEQIEIYTASIETLGKAIPELVKNMENLKAITELNKAAWDGLVAAWKAGDYGKMAEIASLWGRARDAQFEGTLDAYGAGGDDVIKRIIYVEGGQSGGGPSTSSARGIGQFIDSTWLSYLERLYPELSSLNETQKLALRISEEHANKILKAFTRDNQKALLRAGVSAGPAETYLAHFLGSGDAIKVLLANPDELAANVVKTASVNANPGVFSEGMRVRDLIDWSTGKMGGGSPITSSGATEREEELKKQADATKARITNTEFEISQQKLINNEKEKQAAIEAAIREAKAENPDISDAELANVVKLTAELHEQQNVVNEREQSEERVNQLYTLRQNLLEQQKMLEERGDFSGANLIKLELEGVNDQLRQAIDNTIAFYEALGGPEADAAIAKLTTQRMTLEAGNNQIIALGLNAQQFSTLVGSFADGMINAFDGFVQKTLETGDAFRAAGQAFLQFAADFLRQIAMMILKQMMLNALAGFSGPIGTAAQGLGGIAGHTGGLVGSASIGSGNRIGGDSGWTQNAFRYHTGGIVGLRPDEVSATLLRNEEVLTEQDPRHRFNLGGEGGGANGGTRLKQVLAIGDREIANAMAGSAGEQVQMTTIKRNAPTIRRILGLG